MTKSHQTHRKEALAYRINYSRKWWRWYVRINRLMVEVGVEVRDKNV